MLSEERFMKENLPRVDFLKLKGSWGKLGNDRSSGRYDYYQFVNPNGQVAVIGNSLITLPSITAMADPGLTWEKMEGTEVGLEGQFLGQRLAAEFTFFNRVTRDFLASVPVPAAVGNGYMISNAGSMRNRGFEFAASWNGQAGDMTYTITGNLTYTKNKVLSLGDGSDKVDGPCITKVGETIASFYGYKTAGVFQTQEEVNAYVNDKGEKMREDVIGEIEKYLDGEMAELPFATREKIGCTVDYAAGRNRYMGYLMSLAIYSFKGMRIGLDAANGSAWSLAKSIFDALGAKTYVIHAEPDGLNINNGCGSTHIESLCELVKREHLDAGFAFDGDADRCLCVDENGNVINGDHILYIYGCYMKERGKLVDNKVVTTVMSNFGLYKAFDAVGIDYEKTAVGDKYVYECMSKNGYRLGGEQSGHIIFSKYATTGDGIITAIKMMEVMLAKKKTLGQLASPVVIYPQVLKNVRVTDKTEAQNDADVRAAVEAAAEKLGENGRILVRESGTEPVVRVMVEADSVETCEKYVDDVIEVIKNKGYVIG